MGLGFSYIFTTFLKPIVADMNWDRTTFSIAGGPLLFSMALASPLVGSLTDRFGPKWVLSISTLLLATVLVLFGVMQNEWQYYAISLLLGVALTGLGDIPVGAVASRWFAKTRGLALGVIYTGSNIGGSIVPVVATAIAIESSWRNALTTLAWVPLVLVLPFAALVVRSPRPEEAGAEVEMGHEEAPGLDLSAALRTRSFWILALTLFSFYFYYLGVLNHLIAFLSDSGFSDAAAARRFSGAILVGVVGKLAMGSIADRIRVKAALLLNFGLVAVAAILLLYVDVPGVLTLFLVIHGFSVAAENVVLPLIVVEAFGVRHMAQIYGALMFLLLPGGVLGPVFAAYMFDTRGNYDVAFGTFAVLNVIALIALCFVRRERPG